MPTFAAAATEGARLLSVSLARVEDTFHKGDVAELEALVVNPADRRVVVGLSTIFDTSDSRAGTYNMMRECRCKWLQPHLTRVDLSVNYEYPPTLRVTEPRLGQPPS